MRILIVEDDQRLARLMARVLAEEHLASDVANDGDTGLELALRGIYDVVILSEYACSVQALRGRYMCCRHKRFLSHDCGCGWYAHGSEGP